MSAPVGACSRSVRMGDNLNAGALKRRVVDVTLSTVKEAQPKLELSTALRRFWPNLIGLAVLPSLISLGEKRFGIPFSAFLLPFFAAFLLAAWPCLKRNAPYTFWIVACGVWMAGVFAGGILFHALKALD
jgi:hypothetical protein